MCKKYSYADIIRLVIKQASENSGILVSDINIDNNIFDDLGMDEVDFWDFIISLEDTFELELDQDEDENINTIQDAINLVKMKVDKL